MSSTYANVSIPSRPVGASAGRWLVQIGQAVRRALDAAVSARPSQGLQEMASRCERLQPALARELRAAAARVGES
jgi:ribulose 1,5-bisphosphate carboxylase large subunit-like protein